MTFSKEMVKIADELKQNGHIVVLPHGAKQYADGDLQNETSSESIKNKINNDLIRDYFQEIKNSDAILIANFDKNNIKNYIGGNSFLEIGFAHVLNKKIFLLNNIPVISYGDEIVAMQAIVLDNDLLKIK